MKIVYFSANDNIVEEWKSKYHSDKSIVFYDLDSLNKFMQVNHNLIVIADYDSVAHAINELISSNNLPKYTVVLEKSPEITTGKLLIARGIKAYGNSRMLKIHYEQLLNTVTADKIWTYPELTAQLGKKTHLTALNRESQEIVNNRLSEKEIQVTELILEGLTNDAIANKLNIKPRTVKAHVSSIFSKLHVNDRISLVLLLK
jgi:DNA-binding NarL/FixJ family response regulator